MSGKLTKAEKKILDKNFEEDKRKISEYVYYMNGGIKPLYPINLQNSYME